MTADEAVDRPVDAGAPVGPVLVASVAGLLLFGGVALASRRRPD